MSAPTPIGRRLNPTALIQRLRACFPQAAEVEVRRVIATLLHAVFNCWMEIHSKTDCSQVELLKWLRDLNLKRLTCRPPVRSISGSCVSAEQPTITVRRR
ncbi:MAG TPA: hypothetical protein VKV31_01690 [bacterium]|nr:hypothetical protein [bacterium]